MRNIIAIAAIAAAVIVVAAVIARCSTPTPTIAAEAGAPPHAVIKKGLGRRVRPAKPPSPPKNIGWAPTWNAADRQFAWARTAAPTTSLMASPPPITPSSWAVPSWFIDPVGGNNANNCTTSGTPCKTYTEIMSRWGCVTGILGCPILSVPVTITFLTDQPNDTDRVIFRGTIADGGYIYLVGTLTTVTWGSATLGTVTPKYQGADGGASVLLQANLGQAVAPAVGMLLVDTTAGGNAWIDSASGNVATLTQPQAPNTPASPVQPDPAGTEINSFTTGDAFTIKRPTQVYVPDFEPQGIYSDSNFRATYGFIYHIWSPDPILGPGANPSNVNSFVQASETRFDTSVNVTTAFAMLLGPDIDTFGQGYTATNVWSNGGGSLSTVMMSAGAYATGFPGFTRVGSGSVIQGDAIIHGGFSVQGLEVTVENVYTDGAIVVDSNSTMNVENHLGPIYGNYSVLPQTQAAVTYEPPGACKAFLGTPTLGFANGSVLVGSTCDVTNASAPAPSICTGNIPLTIAELDIALDGGINLCTDASVDASRGCGHGCFDTASGARFVDNQF
jgi:hypothetical protein